MGEDALRRLAVGLPAEDAAAKGRAYGDGGSELACRAIAQPRRLRHKLVQRRIDVIGELDLGHGPQAIGGHADRNARYAAFGDRRVEHPRLAIFRSEEHTSELQSLMRISYAVFCLKKKHLL